MKKLYIILCCIGIVLIASIVFSKGKVVSYSAPTTRTAAVAEAMLPETDPYTHTKISLNSRVFNAFVADSNELRQRGLSGFTGLSKNEAMLFVFEKPSTLGFWMKDMLFSLDMVWLDGDKKVVFIEQNVSPDTYPKVFESGLPAQYVIEFAAGTVKRLGTKKGDVVLISGGK